MAGSTLEEGAQRHQKVYSFLKRVLPQDRYEGIRVIEPCVVVADGFKKTFQFAVLGDEMLYITENPPRTSKDIRLRVDLACVTSVELIHDVAEFLGGDLKTKNQHILLVYKKIFKQTASSQAVAIPSSENNSALKLALQSSSILSTSPVLRVDSTPQVGDNLKSKTSMGRVESQPITIQHLSVQTNRLHLSASDPDLRHPRHENSKLYSGSTNNIGAVSASPRNTRPLPPPPPGHESVITQSSSGARLRSGNFGQQRRKKMTASQQKKPSNDYDELDCSSSSSELEISYQCTSNNFNRQKSVDSSGQNRACSPYGRSRYGSDSNGSMDSGGELDYYSDDESNDSSSNNFELMEMDLYILSEKSPMYMHLKSTWNNCILKSTLHHGRRSSTPTSPTGFNKVDNSQLLHLFNQLKTEILQSHIMEKTFILVQELLTAAEKSFNLKKYFWKSPDLFLFMVSQLKRYMPQSRSQSSSSRKKGSNREDELDFVVVLLQTFVCLFRETDILSTRLMVIKAHKGQAIKELLKCIVLHPLTTSQQPASISPAAQLLLSGADRNMFTVGDREKETDKLLKEVLDNATSLLFELMCAVRQANCFSVEDNVLNIYWLMKIVETQEQTTCFVQRVMERLTSLVLSSGRYLSPADAVLLYRQLYVLKNFLEYGTVVANQIRVGYAEEFRYYIRKPVVKKKLSTKFPLTSPTIELLEKVTEFVLKQPSLR